MSQLLVFEKIIKAFAQIYIYTWIKVCYSKVFAINFVQTINQLDFYLVKNYLASLYN
jgi:hypothetical protein